MSGNKTVMRIVQDVYDFNKNKPEGIYLSIDKNNLMKQYALIVGPKDTPYFGGFFFFEITYPEDYPKKSPGVTLLTTEKNVRFNPNLYECGKVCLSILGTWSGPSWSPVMNIRLVLDSIRSLMGTFPIQNEPGYENTKQDDIASIEYNQYIIYHTYRLAIIEVLNNKFTKVSSLFEKELKEEFDNNKSKLSDDLLSYEQIYGKITVENRVYFMKRTKLDFNLLKTNFENFIIGSKE
jgi:ubiquitin-conjugating enzyme E2 Z